MDPRTWNAVLRKLKQVQLSRCQASFFPPDVVSCEGIQYQSRWNSDSTYRWNIGSILCCG
jgi:hypothetical protein